MQWVIWDEIHIQMCTERVTVGFQMPKTPCMKFQTLALAHKSAKGSVAPFLQAPIQHNMPASVKYSITADLLAVVSCESLYYTLSTIPFHGSLIMPCLFELVKKSTSNQHQKQRENIFQEELGQHPLLWCICLLKCFAPCSSQPI